MMSLGKLYFPELATTLRNFDLTCGDYTRMCNQIGLDAISARLTAFTAAMTRGRDEQEAEVAGQQAANAVRERTSDNLATTYGAVYRNILLLDDAASELMAQIIAVPETPEVAEE
jgi:hypothetical protein